MGSSLTGSAWVTGGGPEVVVEDVVVAPVALASGLLALPQAPRRVPVVRASASERERGGVMSPGDASYALNQPPRVDADRWR
jgi:hypothetical protein